MKTTSKKIALHPTIDRGLSKYRFYKKRKVEWPDTIGEILNS